MITDDPFDQSRFSRRYTLYLEGYSIKVSSPEDTILAKLNWAKKCGGSEKQFADAVGVYEVQYQRLDMEYIEHWAKILQIEPLLERLKREANIH